MNGVSNRVSSITAQIRANEVAAAQLQSENQQIKTEIYKIIHEITDTSLILGEEAPNPEWFWILSSRVETQMLQYNYDELWNSRLHSPSEITADLYAAMIRKHNNLLGLYKQTLESYTVLQDDLQRLTWRLTTPLGVCILTRSRLLLTQQWLQPDDAPFLIHLEVL